MKFVRLFATLSMGRLAILSLVLTVAYYFMSFDDGSQINEQIKSVQAEIGVEKARRSDIEKTMKKEEEMRGNLLQLARNLDVLKSKIPFDFKDTEMSTIVNQASINTDIKISILSRMSPAMVQKKPGTGAELLDEIVFEISATGTFAQLIRFVEVLSKEEKVIKTRNFSIEKNSSNVDDNLIKFKGEIVGFKQVSAATSPAGGVRK
jgi:Tfp pilus assembly protein PilO